MSVEHKGSLQRTMVVYLLMIAFASLVIGAEFVLDVQSSELRSDLIQGFDRLSRHEISADEALQPVQQLRNKALLMVALLLVVVAVLLTMFIKNITGPLQHMIEVSRLIAAGDLSQTVRIQTRNELAEMGSTINDLTSNLQEMLLLSRDLCIDVERVMEGVSDHLKTQALEQEHPLRLQHEMRFLKSRTRFLNDIILNCKFYRIGKIDS